jgi:Immunoglobulin I-set domain.
VIGPINVEPVIAGSRVLFTCTCNRGSIDDLTITWYKDGVLASNVFGIRKEDGNRYTATIFIEKVRPEHHGRYTCIAKNRAGKMARHTDFVVYGLLILIAIRLMGY